MREDANPGLSFSLEVAVDRDPAGFDLAVGHPSATESLESEIPEADIGSPLGIPAPVAAVRLPELGSFGH